MIESGKSYSQYGNESNRKDILLITRRKGFWSSKVCDEAFPRHLFLRAKSTRLEQFAGAFLGLILITLYCPKVVLLGTRSKVVPIYAKLRKFGLLRKIKIITDCQYLSEEVASKMDRIIVYSKGEIEFYSPQIRNRFVFLPFPSKIELVEEADNSPTQGKYIFCGGSNMRDHKSFIESIRHLSVEVVIVTDKPLPLNIPDNCRVYGHQPLKDYIRLMAGSLFVVVPLIPSKLPHGHSDISLAMSLGKTVVSTKEAGVEDYISDGHNGLLVSHSEPQAYQAAITALIKDKSFLDRLSIGAKVHGRDFSYESFVTKLKKIVDELN